ncbi:MAG TPA: hypothetical protein H9903_07295 [Candidatus Aquabacterium excrementipullorum]|nr:hypothetical protein [Candidatus Aquabacterium excrementipullorum]
MVPPHQRVLSAARARQADTSLADREAARRLERAGDSAYRRAAYAKAFTAYANAYPNAPTAYAYVMAGDAHWRAVLQAPVKVPAPTGAGPQVACALDNRHFPRDLALDLAQHQQVGLALAEAPLRATWWYLRARRSTRCLQGLAQDAARQPPESCADLVRLRACLGPPLPPR